MSSRSKNPKLKGTDAPEVKAKRAQRETDLDSLKCEYVGEAVKSVRPLLLLGSSSLQDCEKVAGFDIYFTVIKTASGRKCATGAKDWGFWDKCVPDKLRELDRQGYRVIFFTNQELKVKPDELTTKIEAIIKDLGIPVLAFVCTGENHYKKPSTLMWEYFEANFNKGVAVDRTKSIYVGDAAGRAKEWAPGKPIDFSCSDRKFAANLDVEFKTPEEFFLGEAQAEFTWGSFNPSEFLAKASKPVKKDYHKKTQEVVIMVGPPASGKSTFRKRYLERHGYVPVNRDMMGTMAKCIKEATKALKEGKSVIVDNTNPTPADRKKFVDCAVNQEVPCRCFLMTTSLDLAHHLNYVRRVQTDGKVQRVPDVAYDNFTDNYSEPTKAEGFSEIVKIDFIPEFDNNTDEKICKQWT